MHNGMKDSCLGQDCSQVFDDDGQVPIGLHITVTSIHDIDTTKELATVCDDHPAHCPLRAAACTMLECHLRDSRLQGPQKSFNKTSSPSRACVSETRR